jgi:hypothetical protein
VRRLTSPLKAALIRLVRGIRGQALHGGIFEW